MFSPRNGVGGQGEPVNPALNMNRLTEFFVNHDAAKHRCD